MAKDPGRLPQATKASEPFQIARRRPSPWAIRLLWASAVFAILALALLVFTLATQPQPGS